MQSMRMSLAALLICGGSVVGGFFGYDLVQEARFARAEQRVELTREQLARVEDLATVFRHIGRVVEPSVVNIDITRTVRAPQRRMPFDDEMLRRFFPELPEEFGEPTPGERRAVGTGSGVIMEAANGYGYILTNHHVAGSATAMVITLADGRRYENAVLVGSDPRTDLAVIRIEADRLIAAQWGNSDELEKGDWVLAFGSPFGFVGSMTHGIVSALGRRTMILGQMGYENFIQTDAAINPGNSGGPLVNLRGEVVGISTAIASLTGGFHGIGFAIPSNQAQYIFEELKEHGRITRGWLGVRIADVGDQRIAPVAQALGYDQTSGVFVQQVFTNSPAAGQLEAGDIITALEGEPVHDSQQLRNRIAATAPDNEVQLRVFREGEFQDVTVRLGEQPDDLQITTGRRPRIPGTAQEATVEALGIQLQTLTEQLAQRFELPALEGGAVVTAVAPGSLAAQAGIRPGDVITRIGAQRVASVTEATEAIEAQDLTEGIRLHVTSREGSRFIFIRSE